MPTRTINYSIPKRGLLSEQKHSEYEELKLKFSPSVEIL